MWRKIFRIKSLVMLIAFGTAPLLSATDRSNEPTPEPTAQVASSTVQTDTNVPLETPTTYQQRKREQEQLAALLRDHDVVVLAGPVATGKSDLALHHAYTVAKEGRYSLVWRLDARNERVLEKSYRDLAARLRISKPPLEVPAVVAAVHQKLAFDSSETSWLLLFDNAPRSELFFSFFPKGMGLPKKPGCKILITSRSLEWPLASVLSISVLDPDEAVAYVSKQLPGRDPDSIQLLCKTLGYHPLALSQACSYLIKTNQWIRRYIATYLSCGKVRSMSEQEQQQNTIETVGIMHDRRAAAQNARFLLNMLSFLDSQPVPFAFLNRMLAAQLGIADRKATVNSTTQALTVCIEYGLVQKMELEEGAHYQMHTLTSQVRRNQISCEIHDRIRMGVVVNGHNLYDWALMPTPELAAEREHMMPHMEHVCVAWRAGRSKPTTVEQQEWDNVGSLYRQLAYSAIRPSQKIKLCTRELEIYETAYGEDHLRTANAIESLGRAHEESGNYDRAREFYQTALEIRVKEVNPLHRVLASSYVNIGGIYDSTGAYDTAIEYYEKALLIYEANPGHDTDRATCYNNIGSAYSNKSDYDKALAYYEKDLAITLKIYGEKHPDTGTSYSNLALAHSHKGDYHKALELFQKSHDIYLATIGGNNSDIAITLGHLGTTHYYLDRKEEAVSLCKEAVDIASASLGPNHITTAILKVKLAFVMAQTDSQLAIGLCEEALPLIEQRVGTEHARMGRGHLVLGVANSHLEKLDVSLPHFQTAVDVFRISQGVDHDETAEAECYLGMEQMQHANADIGRETFEKGFQTLERRLSSAHPKVKKWMTKRQMLVEQKAEREVVRASATPTDGDPIPPKSEDREG